MHRGMQKVCKFEGKKKAFDKGAGRKVGGSGGVCVNGYDWDCSQGEAQGARWQGVVHTGAHEGARWAHEGT